MNSEKCSKLLNLIDEMAQIFNDETIDEPELESLVDSVMPELFDKLEASDSTKAKIIIKLLSRFDKEEEETWN